MVATPSKGGIGSQSPQSREIVMPPLWADAAESAAAAPVVVAICGPKNSGKSTFSRFLLNTLLHRYKRVGYLDTDVGQPEFSLPGFISLNIIDECIQDLANPTLRDSERCFFFGDTSSKRDPEAYLNCVYNLYDYFCANFQRNLPENNNAESIIPLIINTPGWVKGTGYDILVEILKYISPSVVVKLQISAQSKNLPGGMFWLDGEPGSCINVIEISAAQQDSLSRSVLVRKDAPVLRDQRLFEYFKRCFSKEMNISTNKELAFALASIPPYQVDFSKVKVSHLHFRVPTGETWHSLNAAIVGLCVSSEMPARPDSYPWCIGLGIVRGIDVSRGLLYVITPIPIQSLQKVDLLIQGLIEIPTSLLQVKGCASPYMSTNVLHKISPNDS
ncbi:hypothetical protein LUZ60_009593 [Juncus effusus]|nr:hypothetical protein LUZ60_009593 [Juncus effusus]